MMKRIGISAGHYPQKSGARVNGLDEHSLAVYWIDKLFDVYDMSFDFCTNRPPFELIFIPTGTLKEKVSFINANSLDYVVELHFNSAHVKASGSETLYMPKSSRGREMANIVQRFIAPALKIRDRGIKEGIYWSSRERTNTPLYFLKRTNCPAIIIEPEFLQSYDETIDEHTIIDFCFALINGLKEVSNSNV